MKYIRKFDSAAALQAAIQAGTIERPFVAWDSTASTTNLEFGEPTEAPTTTTEAPTTTETPTTVYDHYICTFETESEDEDILICNGLSGNIQIAPNRLIIDGVEQTDEIIDRVTIHSAGVHTVEYYVNNNTAMPYACFTQRGGSPNFTSITLPDYLTEIRSDVCYGQSALTSIICPAVNPPILEATYEGDYSQFTETNDCPIYVPASSVDAYKAASGWSEYADRIQAI